jgi:hypothetical protein
MDVATYLFMKERFAAARKRDFEEAIAKAWAAALVTVLEARGISLTDEARRRIDEVTRQRFDEVTDPAILDAWVRRAATATTLDDVFPPA